MLSGAEAGHHAEHQRPLHSGWPPAGPDPRRGRTALSSSSQALTRGRPREPPCPSAGPNFAVLLSPQPPPHSLFLTCCLRLLASPQATEATLPRPPSCLPSEFLVTRTSLLHLAHPPLPSMPALPSFSASAPWAPHDPCSPISRSYPLPSADLAVSTMLPSRDSTSLTAPQGSTAPPSVHPRAPQRPLMCTWRLHSSP